MWRFLTSEPAVRLSFFGGVLAVMAMWEVLAPRRPWTVSRPIRWISNLGLVFLNSLLLRLVAPLGLVGVATLAETRGWGLFQNVALAYWLGVAAGVVLLDLAIYLQHVMFHAVPLFWRLHMVHHADLDFDVTTGVRFHTLEILLSFGIKAAVVLLLGVVPVSVLIFEVLLNATSMFNHGNVRMPVGLDRLLRWFVVTPEMHRVHHSIIVGETEQQLRFQSSLVGLSAGHLSRPARRGPHRYDNRLVPTPRRTPRRQAPLDARASCDRKAGFISDQPARIERIQANFRACRHSTPRTRRALKTTNVHSAYGFCPIIALAAKAVMIPYGRFTSSR